MAVRAIETRYKGYRFRSQSLPYQPGKKIARRANYSGVRFGKCVAVECLGVADGGYRWWGCLCDCGMRFAARSRELRRGHTQSCGCLQREAAARNGGRNRLPKGHASRNELLASYKKSAGDRGIEWSITNELFFQIISLNCAYCGTPAELERKPNAGVNGGFTYSGIDRVDNSIGYLLGNVVPCCWNCNRAKGRLSLTDFLLWMNRVAAYESARSARFEHGETPR